MIYEICENLIVIKDKTQFDPKHILECGQIFSFFKKDDVWSVFSKNECAKIVEYEDCFKIECSNVDYFVNFFDLNCDYNKIKMHLSKFEILKKPVEFGYGIRILKNDVFETLISFIISANNNIKRIQSSLFQLREKLGEFKNGYYCFPTYEALKLQNEDFFKTIGCGYRAKYLIEVLKQINPEKLESWNILPTEELKKHLIQLCGVGPKVADCILLFGYGKQDVFPVDTWIEKVFNQYIANESDRNKIRNQFVDMFGGYSGYAQQYLFYYQRDGKF